jgi:ABC-type nitrate/sulfonate/bicarbonate transport system permease component
MSVMMQSDGSVPAPRVSAPVATVSVPSPASLTNVRAELRRRHPLQGAVTVGTMRLLNFMLFLVVVGVLWQLAVSVLKIPAYLMPGLPQTLHTLFESRAVIGHATLFTVACTLAGMCISVLVALLLALLFIASDTASRALTPIIIVIRTVPMIAIAPLLLLIFGRDQWNSIGMVALLTFFQIMLAAKKGFQAPSANMLEMMRTYGAGFFAVLFKVRLPCAIPFLFTGLQIAAGSAILCAMFAEWLSGAPGLGTLMLDAYSSQNFALMWATLLASTAAAYLFLTFTIMVERAVLDWSR